MRLLSLYSPYRMGYRRRWGGSIYAIVLRSQFFIDKNTLCTSPWHLSLQLGPFLRNSFLYPYSPPSPAPTRHVVNCPLSPTKTRCCWRLKIRGYPTRRMHDSKRARSPEKLMGNLEQLRRELPNAVEQIVAVTPGLLFK